MEQNLVNIFMNDGKREKLIRLFTFEGKPYHLQYNYRKVHGPCTYAQDKPILNQLIREGLVRVVEKNMKTILFEYVGPVPQKA